MVAILVEAVDCLVGGDFSPSHPHEELSEVPTRAVHDVGALALFCSTAAVTIVSVTPIPILLWGRPIYSSRSRERRRRRAR